MPYLSAPGAAALPDTEAGGVMARTSADRMRDYRARLRQRASIERRPGDERLRASCWCEATVVEVFASQVRAGRTGSCGRAVCHG